jgi:hypothetical protein
MGTFNVSLHPLAEAQKSRVGWKRVLGTDLTYTTNRPRQLHSILHPTLKRSGKLILIY